MQYPQPPPQLPLLHDQPVLNQAQKALVRQSLRPPREESVQEILRRRYARLQAKLRQLPHPDRPGARS